MGSLIQESQVRMMVMVVMVMMIMARMVVVVVRSTFHPDVAAVVHSYS